MLHCPPAQRSKKVFWFFFSKKNFLLAALALAKVAKSIDFRQFYKNSGEAPDWPKTAR